MSHYLIEILKLYHKDPMSMTLDQASAFANLVPERLLCSGSYVSQDFAKAMSEAFPQFSWRVATDRTGYYARTFLTILKDDPREHYVREGEACVHCGKFHRVKCEPVTVTCPKCQMSYVDDSDWSGPAHPERECIQELQRKLALK